MSTTDTLESVYDSLPEIHKRLSMQQFYAACLPLRAELEAEVEQLSQWAAFCHSCARSGELPMGRQQFVQFFQAKAAKAAKGGEG